MDGSNQPRDDHDYVLGRDGKPLRDRYGRPISRRRQSGRPAGEPEPRPRPRAREGYFTAADVERLRRMRDDADRRADRRSTDGPRHRAADAADAAGSRRAIPSDRADRADRPAGSRRATWPTSDADRDRPSPRAGAGETQILRRPEGPGSRGGRGERTDDPRADRYRSRGRGRATASGRPLLPGQDDPRFPPRGYDPDRDFSDPSSDEREWDEGGRAGDRRRKATATDRNRRRRRGDRPRSDRPRRSLRFKIRAVLLVLLLVVGLGAAWVDVNLNRVDAFDGNYDRPGRSLATNWLIVGSDSRAGLSEEDAAKLSTGADDVGQRTDTIMIAHFPLVGEGRLVSIPRDSYVEIPGYGMNKINAAYSFGGAQLLAQTIEQNTGIRIDHYAEIGFGGFASIVDAMGGIEMCPDEAIDDPLAGLNIQPGCQKFDGAAGLGYVRTRATAQGDLDRVARQREFIGAMMRRVKSPAVWLNPWRVFRVSTVGAKALTVDGGDHVWHLAWLMFRLALGTESETVPTAGTMDTPDAGNVLLWDDAAAPVFFDGLK